MMESLYIHIPFCEKKCFYCSFVVSVGQEHRMDDYLRCLEKEAHQYQGTRVETIYVGGGTPTFLNEGQLVKLFTIIKNNFQFEKKCEITIEANPEGLNVSKIKFLKELMVNRISLGIQTLNDQYLQYLGRCHDSQKARIAVQALQQAGFDNINLDLMYAFPQQTHDEIEEDVKQICAFKSQHLSLYTLTIEENSRFYTKKIHIDNETQAKQYLLVVELLKKYGFNQYEVSNFSKDGRESKHNTNYWLGGNYIGLGVGAHSHQNGRRWWNVPKLNTYMSRIIKNDDPVEITEELTVQQRLKECLLLGLRMNQGVDISSIEQRTGCCLDKKTKEIIDQFVGNNFLHYEEKKLKATSKGRLVLDEISSQLI